MARPKKCRCVAWEPGVTFFKPQGIPLRTLEHVVIGVDELEALRLSDFLGLSHEEVAQEMNVSRPTVTRMLSRAHQAVADALVNGKAIKIAGGDYKVLKVMYKCNDCLHQWDEPQGSDHSHRCPLCQGNDIERFTIPASSRGLPVR